MRLALFVEGVIPPLQSHASIVTRFESNSISARTARSSGSFLSRVAATCCAITFEPGQRQLNAITPDNNTDMILDGVFIAVLEKKVAVIFDFKTERLSYRSLASAGLFLSFDLHHGANPGEVYIFPVQIQKFVDISAT
jgi:hypothetical protein